MAHNHTMSESRTAFAGFPAHNFTTVQTDVPMLDSNLKPLNNTDMIPCMHPDIFNVTEAAPIEYARVMYGIMMPVLVAVTLVANSLIVAVVTRRHMKTPTNLVLLWLAVADLLTLLSPAPWYLYMYTLGYHEVLLGESFICYMYSYMTEHVPMFFHTTSIWLTCLLALQRSARNDALFSLN